MSHKNFRAIYINRDESRQRRDHLTKKNKKYTNEKDIVSALYLSNCGNYRLQ